MRSLFEQNEIIEVQDHIPPMLEPLPIQKKFLKKGLLDPAINLFILSVARGNGKSFLQAFVICNLMIKSNEPYLAKLYKQGKESVLISGSLEQARNSYKPARQWLEKYFPNQFSFIDSARSLGIRCKFTNTRLRVHSSNSKTAFGMGSEPFIFLDEPASLEEANGTQLWDAIETSLGKPESTTKVMAVGTLAPAKPGNWWPRLVKSGSRPGVYVEFIQGNDKTWPQWNTIRKANPVMSKFPNSRKQLLAERDEALKDTRLEARFKSYRLNLPSVDETEILLATADWNKILQKTVPERQGQPIVGIDVGASQSWCGATAIYKNGRVEALAVCPGYPTITDMEKRDGVPPWTYQRLVENGSLTIATGLRIVDLKIFVRRIKEKWGIPRMVICDHFRINQLRDAAPSWNMITRRSRWSEASEDITAFRKHMLDGSFSIAEDSQLLIGTSLAVSATECDKSGNLRLVKKTNETQSRDDVISAFVLASGEYDRIARKPKQRIRSIVVRENFLGI